MYILALHDAAQLECRLAGETGSYKPLTLLPAVAMVPGLSDTVWRSAVYYSERLKWAEPIDEAELGGSLCQSQEGLTWFKMAAGAYKSLINHLSWNIKKPPGWCGHWCSRFNSIKWRQNSINLNTCRSEWKDEKGLLQFRSVNNKEVQLRISK